MQSASFLRRVLGRLLRFEVARREDWDFRRALLNLAMVRIDGDSLLYRVEYGRKTLENTLEDTGIVKETFEFHNNP